MFLLCAAMMWMGFLLLAVLPAEAAIDGDRITSLPGLQTELKFQQYSGYLKALGGRQLHYWFIESARNPASDPLVVWMNGGPGCSSLDGLLAEHGPFKPTRDGKTLTLNPYSWNTVANMLYLEAPAGVGYSYAADGNITTNDDETADNNHAALKYFMQNFPEFKKNDFYITGESYGGIYVPTLSVRVQNDTDFNFKGFAIGNGVTDRDMSSNAMIFYGYYHGLWGRSLWKDLVSNCCEGSDTDKCDFAHSDNPACQNALHQAHSIIRSMNIYNLYADCYHGQSNGTVRESLFHPFYQLFIHNKYIQQKKLKLLALPKTHLSEVPPCIDATNSTEYLNRKDVRAALHIKQKLPKWEICSGEVGAHYNQTYSTVANLYLQILASKSQKILVYNGDADMACNFLGDQWFVDSLGQTLLSPWQQWFYTDASGSKQVAGFVKKYENLSFVTIKGAGHMVPQDKPVQALKMFKAFLGEY